MYFIVKLRHLPFSPQYHLFTDFGGFLLAYIEFFQIIHVGQNNPDILFFLVELITLPPLSSSLFVCLIAPPVLNTFENLCSKNEVLVEVLQQDFFVTVHFMVCGVINYL